MEIFAEICVHKNALWSQLVLVVVKNISKHNFIKLAPGSLTLSLFDASRYSMKLVFNDC